MNVKYNRQDILIKGIQLIRKQGYGNTGIQDILKACKIPKGSFYNYFASKQTFTLEAIILYKESIIEILNTIDQNDEISPSKKLTTFFMKSNEIFISENCNQNCFLLSLTNDITDQNNAFSKPIKDSFELYKNYLSKWINAAQKKRNIRQDINANDLANLLFDSYHGAVLRMKYQQNPNPLHNFIENTLKIIT